jgi:putative flippase GtrA
LTKDQLASRKRKHRRIILFVIAGGIAAGVNVISRIALGFITTYELSIVLAYLCGMTTAYTLNKAFVFEPSGRPVREEYFRFAIVNLIAVIQVWIISVGLARFLFPELGFQWHGETVAHIIGVIVPTVSSYIGHQYFSFAAVSRPPTGT